MHTHLIFRLSLIAGTTQLFTAAVMSAVEPTGNATDNVAAAAQDFISQLQQGKSADAAKRFDATMQKAFPPQQLQAAWEANVAEYGKFQKSVPGRVTHVEKWDVADIACVFEKATV